ncbi:hypothetical protein [Nesterenkonia populi]|uniref:hypothetical protein n=1 Tax=Nesterenkonia populi TaxID=1591087 RepID=UPI0011BF2870|nr:hypothetical protein [Nesterenkonia populi]
MSELQDSIDRLTRDHERPLAQGKTVTVPGLLAQLDAAVTEQKRGGSAGNEIAIPVSPGAMRIQAEVADVVRSESLEQIGTHAGRVADLLKRWPEEGGDLDHLEHVALDLCDKIEALVDPGPPRRPLRERCPACGQRWVLDEDGHRSECLTAGVFKEDGTLKLPADYDVECLNCSAHWAGKDLAGVLKRLPKSLLNTGAGIQMTAV